MATYHIIKQEADGQHVVGSFEASEKAEAKAKAAALALEHRDGSYVMALQIGESFAVETKARVEGLAVRAKTEPKANGKGKKKTGLNPAAKLPKGGEVPPA